MSDIAAVIALQQEISLQLSVTDKNGNPSPGAVISNVVWQQDDAIGTITPDATDPAKAIYKPSAVGITHIKATATVTIP